MKIASFNVNGVTARLGNLLEWLAETQPDVACLQELKTVDERFPADAIEKAGYGAIWHGQKSWNGVAILGRGVTPIETMRGLPGDPGDVQSRYIEAAVKGVIVASIYAPNGNPVGGPKYAFKLGWYDRFVAHAQWLMESGQPVVLAGDYNIIPTDADVYAPDRWRDDALFQPELKAVYADLVEAGWADALRRQFPTGPVYTFWKYWRNAFQRDAGLRIDHLLMSPTAAARFEAAGVDREHRGREHASDHAPVWVRLAKA